jgi:arabinogalactan endo-1,4-beta-galactosidase
MFKPDIICLKNYKGRLIISKSIVYLAIIFLLINTGQSQCLIIGADLSYVNSIQANGGIYRDNAGNIIDPYFIFSERGANMVRIRLWHTPENIIDHCGNPISTNNLTDVVLAFQRAKAQGMKLNLAIHYGDYFNDPGKQKMPKAWEGLSHELLLDSIYNYTYFVLERFEAEGVRPDIVAIGNETTWGFIDETATTNGWSWPEDADKFNVALSAVDNFNNSHKATVKKALHFTDNTAEWLAGLFTSQDITNYDVIGISFYPVWTELTLQNLGDLIKSLKNTYNKEIVIFETGAPWTTENADNYSNFMNDNGNLNYPVSKQGQKDFLYDLANTVYKNGGSGILYWEPAWISSEMCDFWGQGSSYENASFFDFNNGNAILPAFDIFNFCDNLVVDEFDDSNSISIFPNPTTSNIEINGLRNFTEIRVTDNMGRVVGKFISDKNIDIGYLTVGVYSISILLDKTVITKRIIKE